MTIATARVLLAVACGLLAAPWIAAQDMPRQSPLSQGDVLPPRPSYGLFGDLAFNMHTAALPGLPGVLSCAPEYHSAFGLGPSLGAEYMHPVGGALLLGVRAGYVSSSATLARDEAQTVEIDGDAVPITIEHRIDASLASLSLMPSIGWRASTALTLSAGGEIGWVLDAEFAQSEQLSDAEPRGTFDTGERVRNEASGPLPGASTIRAALQIGASYDIPLNAARTLVAAPEVIASYGLTPVISGASWSAHAIRLGVALRYSPLPSQTPMPIMADVFAPLTGSIRAAGIAADGTEEPAARVRVEELVASDIRPLLGYVFFESGQSAIPARYTTRSATQLAAFNTDALHASATLEVYRELLNIIGHRMTGRPASRISLVGTHAGATNEAGGRELSRRRAEAIREYFATRWSIDASRIDIEAIDLPMVPSNANVAEGIAENRRVEITSTDPYVLAPVRTSDTVRRTTPPGIRFHMTASDSSVTSWRVSAMQNGELLKELVGSGPLPESVDWNIESEQGSVPRAPGSLQYRMTLANERGDRFVSPMSTLAVEQVTMRSKRRDRMADVNIERYNLILFAYDRAEMSDEHRRVLSEIRSNIAADARVTIVGYTDRTGDETHNAQLALERARAVAAELQVDESRMVVRGATEPRHDQSLPEGRFHSRGVEIEIHTPVAIDEPGSNP